ncbi:MAG: hypothetical protein EA397_05620 [Deltaproteobacteria bacterium]|nr:MAG: hypothetical protein EA397_05620 [Deltaproteobacteria bacterium]
MQTPTLACLSLLLVACDPGPTLTDPVQHAATAFMSVGGTGPDDVWIVGAQPGPQSPPTVLHLRDEQWRSIDTRQLHSLWWVHSFQDGPTFLGGAGATVLKIEGDEIERTPTPPFFGNTVFGVWGPDPEDVWAVGGFAGRQGFIWRYDGAHWSSMELPDDVPRSRSGEIPSLFKVWGRSADDVWFVGGEGLVMHYDGDALRVIPSGTQRPLFTVFGDDDEVFIVGGDDRGVVLRGDVHGLTDDSPLGAPLLQGVTINHRGRAVVAGAGGYIAERRNRGWRTLDLEVAQSPQSIHALWHDGHGGLWGAGGAVLSAALDEGIVCTSVPDTPEWTGPELPPPPSSCPDHAIDPLPDETMARRWVEMLLNSIRRDIPHPPKHARNIHHVTALLYDVWAANHERARGIHFDEAWDLSPEQRDIAMAYASYRLLTHRYASSTGAAVSLDCYDSFMEVLGLDPSITRTTGDDGTALGNLVGQHYISTFANDGANEAGDYADTTGWSPGNPVMLVDRPGTNVIDPDEWQQLNLGVAETQNGIILEESVQPYIGPHWKHVVPFALEPDPVTGTYGDPLGPYPTVDDPRMVDWVIDVIARTAELDANDGVMIDVSPGAIGNNGLGDDDGTGYPVNPVTGEPYAPNIVPRGDFSRVVAEMWADGPDSETPPGHWLRIATEVTERLVPVELIPFGVGEPVDRLEWEVVLYATLGGAVHDAAISAWELKRDSLGPRPITLVRWMAEKGQRSDESLPSYDPDGLPLVPGLIELITEESTAPGERHRHLKPYIGEVAVWSWPGEPGDRHHDFTPLQWMRAKDWIPYQRRTFVTPAFPGFTSGHSTFSRAAAEVLAETTGTPFFPGGMHSWTAYEHAYLEFESGPTVDVELQWATYYDAADQSGQSRIWGGIHIVIDDYPGRINGAMAGLSAAERMLELWQGDEHTMARR